MRPETATRGQERRQRGKEDNETDGEGVYRMLLSGLMVADGSGKATKGGAAAPGVNVNGCQCQSVKFLASDLGVERNCESSHLLVAQSVDVCTLFVRQTHNRRVQPHTRVVSAPLTRLPSHKTFALWTHSRITPKSQISSFESSLSEEQIRGRRRFCRKYATPRRVQ